MERCGSKALNVGMIEKNGSLKICLMLQFMFDKWGGDAVTNVTGHEEMDEGFVT